ncbi:EamA family transporter [Enterococcus faecalis]
MMNELRILMLLLLTTFTGSAGALALKKGMNVLPVFSLKYLLVNVWLYLGSLLYIFSAITNIWLFAYLDYSIAFPMTSLTYIWTVIISYFIFKEQLTLRKFLAIGLIILGVAVISH